MSKVGKELVYDLHTLVVEERPEDDLKLRRTLRSADLATVRGANLEAAESREDVVRLAASAIEQGDLKGGVSSPFPSCIACFCAPSAPAHSVRCALCAVNLYLRMGCTMP